MNIFASSDSDFGVNPVSIVGVFVAMISMDFIGEGGTCLIGLGGMGIDGNGADDADMTVLDIDDVDVFGFGKDFS